MDYSDLLQGYDMLTAISQKKLNEELVSCFEQAQIAKKIDFSVSVQKDSKVKTPLDCSLQVNLLAPSIAIIPGVNDAQNVLFALRIKDGKLSSSMFTEALPINDWEYVFTVNLAKEVMTVEAAKERTDISQKIKDQLSSFPSDAIQVTVVYISFENIDTTIYDPTSQCPLSVDWGGGSLFDKNGQNEEVLSLFQTCLKEYFNGAAINKSYILGYMITVKDPQKDFISLPLFNPSGCAYTVTYNQEKPQLSTLNFMLVTNGHPLPASVGAGLFKPWVKSSIDGRIVIGRSLLITRWIMPKVVNALAWSTAQGDTSKIKVTRNESGWLLSNDFQKKWEDKSLSYTQVKKREVQVSIICNQANNAKVTLSGDYEDKLSVHDSALAKGAITAKQTWSIDILFNVTSEGVLMTKVIPDIGKPAPVVVEENTAMKILNFFMSGELKSQMEQEGTDWASHEHELAACLMDQLSGKFGNRFILPSGQPLVCKNIEFDNAGDLLIDIQML